MTFTPFEFALLGIVIIAVLVCVMAVLLAIIIDKSDNDFDELNN